LENLKLAGVGSKPTIFITHSMGMLHTALTPPLPISLPTLQPIIILLLGGLITLQVLKYASEQEEYRPLLSNTKGIVFYSTPHRGVSWTDLAAFPVNNFFFRVCIQNYTTKHTSLSHTSSMNYLNRALVP